MLQYFTVIISSRPPEISYKLWETWEIFPIRQLAPCDNNGLMDLNSNFQISKALSVYLHWMYFLQLCTCFWLTDFAIKSILIAFLKKYNLFSLLKCFFFLATFKCSIIWILVFLDNKCYLTIGIWSSNDSFTNFHLL